MKCPYCSHQPTSDSDYCNELKPIYSKDVDILVKRIDSQGKYVRLSEKDRKLILRILRGALK